MRSSSGQAHPIAARMLGRIRRTSAIATRNQRRHDESQRQIHRSNPSVPSRPAGVQTTHFDCRLTFSRLNLCERSTISNLIANCIGQRKFVEPAIKSPKHALISNDAKSQRVLARGRRATKRKRHFNEPKIDWRTRMSVSKPLRSGS